MAGVFKNVNYLVSRKNSQTWGKDSWKKVVVCVVSDGRGKINPRTRSVLAGMGCYQEGIAKQSVNDKPVTAHIYEVDPNGQFWEPLILKLGFFHSILLKLELNFRDSR